MGHARRRGRLLLRALYTWATGKRGRPRVCAASIEGQWRVLRERLEARAPDDMETRESFLARLRRTVDWLNRNRVERSTQLCTNLKTRAHELKELAGARTKW